MVWNRLWTLASEANRLFSLLKNTQSCPPTHLPVICKNHYHFHIPMRSGHISIQDASRHTLKNATFINTQFTPRLQCWVDAEGRMIHGLEDKVFTASQSEATCELVHTGSSFKWMSLWDINRRKKNEHLKQFLTTAVKETIHWQIPILTLARTLLGSKETVDSTPTWKIIKSEEIKCPTCPLVAPALKWHFTSEPNKAFWMK